MNIQALMGVSQPATLTDKQEIVNPDEGAEQIFDELLQMFVGQVSEQVPEDVELTDGDGEVVIPDSVTEQPNEQMPSLDLAEEALINSRAENLASLTEIRAALQPLVNQSGSGGLFEAVDDAVHTQALESNDEDTEQNSSKITPLKELPVLISLPVRSDPVISHDLPAADTVSVDPAVGTTDDLPSETSPTSSVVPTAAQNVQPPTVVLPTPAARTSIPNHESQPISPPNVMAPSDTTAAAQTLPAGESRTAGSLTDSSIQLANNQPTTYPSNAPEVVDTSPAKPTVNSQSEPAPVSVQPIAPAAAAPTNAVAEITQIETSSKLPDIPALHQIKESIGILTQKGETMVRLHLQPESLGQLLVQLHLVDGNVEVQMLAETSQARALIQDHLAQLKTAFAAQGLQVDGLTVSVGDDSSTFDPSGRQSPNEANTFHSNYVDGQIDDTTQSKNEGTTSSLWGITRSIDYQV